ncbi:MAG: hypothetical protein IPP69_17625 [Flavobacteriales bacterium]|nr:hypothetical protein [Flavobacteriales bacterium]
MTEEQYVEAARFIDQHIVFIYPDERHSVKTLHELFENLILEHGIDGVVVDPYNQIEKLGENTTEQEVAEFMKAVNRFAKYHGIVYNIVIHPKNLSLPKGEEFKAADINNLAVARCGEIWLYDIISVPQAQLVFRQGKRRGFVVVLQKIKRKRTGGQQGQATFYHDFLKARYYSVSQDGSGKKYYCDPDRRAAKDQNALWDMESKSSIKPNTSFAVSSQDVKESENPFETDPLTP